jgi:cytochrome P450
MEVDGRRLDDDDVLAVIFNLIGGGLDTTTSLTSLALHHLEAHPELRARLASNPELLGAACEEYLRWTSVNETLTRTCTRDTELGGQQIRRGDVVMMSWLGANFDPTAFERPEDVDIDRAPNPHLAFGIGTHRCIGMHVARALFQVMVSQILNRIPDYIVDQSATRFYQGDPELCGVVRMPVRFTPGKAVGVERPF